MQTIENIRYLKLPDGRFVQMRQNDKFLQITIPREVNVFGWDTLIAPVVCAVLGYFLWRPIFLFFVFVAFNKAIPFWLRVMMFPVYIILFLLCLVIFVVAMFEMYSTRRLYFFTDHLCIEKRILFFRNKKRIEMTDVGMAYSAAVPLIGIDKTKDVVYPSRLNFSPLKREQPNEAAVYNEGEAKCLTGYGIEIPVRNREPIHLPKMMQEDEVLLIDAINSFLVNDR